MESIAVLVALNTTSGAITAYGGEFAGQPLFCSTPSRPLYYDSQSPQWIALPFKKFGVTWRCWDRVYIPGYGLFTALDTGPFGDHCVVDGDECLPIVADMPVIDADQTSIRGEVINLSAIRRALSAGSNMPSITTQTPVCEGVAASGEGGTVE